MRCVCAGTQITQTPSIPATTRGNKYDLLRARRRSDEQRCSVNLEKEEDGEIVLSWRDAAARIPQHIFLSDTRGIHWAISLPCYMRLYTYLRTFPLLGTYSSTYYSTEQSFSFLPFFHSHPHLARPTLSTFSAAAPGILPEIRRDLFVHPSRLNTFLESRKFPASLFQSFARNYLVAAENYFTFYTSTLLFPQKTQEMKSATWSRPGHSNPPGQCSFRK